MSYIYKITNLIDNKIYIGETNRTIDIRWRQHKVRAKDPDYQTYLYNAMRKYGIDNFEVEELEVCSPEERFERETYYILKYNSLAPNGYNLILSQNGPTNASVDAMVKLWEEGLSLVKIGEILHTDPKSVGENLKGRGISQQEIFQRRTDGVKKRSSKAIIQYNLEGDYIKDWPSASEAARQLQYNVSSICKCCHGDVLTYKGYIWQEKNKDDIENRVLLIKSKPKCGVNKKGVICIDENGNIINEYESASAAGRAFNVAHAGIAYAARNGTIAYGYYWQYKT